MTALGLFLLKQVLTQPRRWKAADTSDQQGWWSPSGQMKAPQASKGDETYGCLFPHSGFTCAITISIVNSSKNNPGQAQQRKQGALSIWTDKKRGAERLLSGHIQGERNALLYRYECLESIINSQCNLFCGKGKEMEITFEEKSENKFLEHANTG